MLTMRKSEFQCFLIITDESRDSRLFNIGVCVRVRARLCHASYYLKGIERIVDVRGYGSTPGKLSSFSLKWQLMKTRCDEMEEAG